jgi:hypothetical protein
MEKLRDGKHTAATGPFQSHPMQQKRLGWRIKVCTAIVLWTPSYLVTYGKQSSSINSGRPKLYFRPSLDVELASFKPHAGIDRIVCHSNGFGGYGKRVLFAVDTNIGISRLPQWM